MAHTKTCRRYRIHEAPGQSRIRGILRRGIVPIGLSISVAEVGSLLDHSGPIGEAERNAARVFGSDRIYFVTNGLSTSNRVILIASATRNQIALCDRNCHKSVEHAMPLSGAIPTYLMPARRVPRRRTAGDRGGELLPARLFRGHARRLRCHRAAVARRPAGQCRTPDRHIDDGQVRGGREASLGSYRGRD